MCSPSSVGISLCRNHPVDAPSCCLQMPAHESCHARDVKEASVRELHTYSLSVLLRCATYSMDYGALRRHHNSVRRVKHVLLRLLRCAHLRGFVPLRVITACTANTSLRRNKPESLPNLSRSILIDCVLCKFTRLQSPVFKIICQPDCSSKGALIVRPSAAPNLVRSCRTTGR